ncbi:hypothetical protein TKK_0016763 [Trichogramma kaykai]|uniref:PRANC domain-containing protein n=1 Tax=Trichogramma kaykai TaxID=54128 RepID=A0ABD2W4P1_9HYME
MKARKKCSTRKLAIASVGKLRNQFIKKFTRETSWTDKDLFKFIDGEFVNKNEGTKWVMKVAIETNQRRIVELLLQNGAELQVLNDSGQTAIHLAAKNRDFKMVDLLFKYSGNENYCDDEGFTYLHAACMTGNIDMVQKLIDQAANLSIMCHDTHHSTPPLILAIDEGQVKIVELLLKNGADPEVIDCYGNKPIHNLFTYYSLIDPESKMEILKLLIKHNCNVNAKNEDGFSPLYLFYELCCSIRGDEARSGPKRHNDQLRFEKNRLDILLQNNANVKEVFLNGQTLLHLFIRSNICTFSYIDNNSYSPQYYQNEVGSELVETLLKYGADPNAKDDDGNSPLQLAVLCYNYDVVKVLLDYGAHVQSIDFLKKFWDYNDHIPWVEATLKFLRILELLQNKGFEMNEFAELKILKFLIQPEESYTTKKIEKILEYGSLMQFQRFFDRIRQKQYSENMEIDFLELHTRLSHHLLTVKIGKMFIDKKINDCLEKILEYLKKVADIDFQYDYEKEKIEEEIEYIKTIKIKDDVSLHDVCICSPNEACHLLKNSEYWSVINSDDFKNNCRYVSITIKGYIIKSLIRKFSLAAGLEPLMLLTRSNLPLLFCEKVIKYLGNEDILSVCEVVRTET